MKKIQKSKKGFTLVEMVLVIAIIVILAAVLVIGITKYITTHLSVKLTALLLLTQTSTWVQQSNLIELALRKAENIVLRFFYSLVKNQL